jgi:hypothetical protein
MTVTSAVIAMLSLVVRVIGCFCPKILGVPTEAALAFQGSFLFHDRGVSICLICNHVPATRQAGKDSGFSSALGVKHQLVTFIRLSSATIGAVHDYASVV